MKLEDQVTLSFYKELTALKDDKSITLVQHVENKKIYVKKIRSGYDRTLYHSLQECKIKGIPKIHHIIPYDSRIIIIEDYINESTLKEAMEEHGTYSSEEAFDIILQLCKILSQLHELTPPIIHRDIKPSNILLSRENKVTLIDFDASKTYDKMKNQDTVLMGTADYAAPEQFGFSQSDARTDIYALGILLNEMLTGSLPKDKMYNGPYTYILKKCMHMEPSRRYNSVIELANVISKQIPPVSKEIMTKKKSLLPPGFRTKTPWKMAVGVLGYIFIFWISVMSELENMTSQAESTISHIGIFILSLMLVALYTNYNNIAKNLLFIRHPNIIFKVFGYALWSVAIIVAIFMLIDVVATLIA